MKVFHTDSLIDLLELYLHYLQQIVNILNMVFQLVTLHKRQVLKVLNGELSLFVHQEEEYDQESASLFFFWDEI
jgi:hypothetical protein